MQLLALFSTCLLTTLVPVAGVPEATTLLYTKELGWSWPLVGFIAGLAQTAAYAVVFVGGQWMLRWAFLRRQVERVRLKFDRHLRQHFLLVTASSGFAGIPPGLALSAIAAAFHVPFGRYVLVLLAGRVLRMSAVAFAGDELGKHFGRFFG